MNKLEKIATSFVTLYVILAVFVGFQIWQAFEPEIVRESTGGQIAEEHNHGNESSSVTVPDSEMRAKAADQFEEGLDLWCALADSEDGDDVDALRILEGASKMFAEFGGDIEDLPSVSEENCGGTVSADSVSAG